MVPIDIPLGMWPIKTQPWTQFSGFYKILEKYADTTLRFDQFIKLLESREYPTIDEIRVCWRSLAQCIERGAQMPANTIVDYGLEPDADEAIIDPAWHERLIAITFLQLMDPEHSFFAHRCVLAAELEPLRGAKPQATLRGGRFRPVIPLSQLLSDVFSNNVILRRLILYLVRHPNVLLDIEDVEDTLWHTREVTIETAKTRLAAIRRALSAEPDTRARVVRAGLQTKRKRYYLFSTAVV